MLCFRTLENRSALVNRGGYLLLLLILCLSFAARYSVADQPLREGRDHLITISGFEFNPQKLVVAKGDTITWLNKDSAPHNVTISSSHKMITPNLITNQKFTYRVDVSFDYFCGLHPPMTGKIKLTPN